MHQAGTKRFNTGGAIKYLLGTAGTVAVMALLSAAPAFADAIFATGNYPQPNEQNIMFTKGESGSMVTGTTNQSGTMVDFSSTTDTLMATANGQANLTSSDGLINDASISVPGHTFADFILNPENGTGTADVTVTVSNGPFSFTYVWAMETISSPLPQPMGKAFQT